MGGSWRWGKGVVKEEDGRKRPTFASADVCGDWGEGGWEGDAVGGKGVAGSRKERPDCERPDCERPADAMRRSS